MGCAFSLRRQWFVPENSSMMTIPASKPFWDCVCFGRVLGPRYLKSYFGEMLLKQEMHDLNLTCKYCKHHVLKVMSLFWPILLPAMCETMLFLGSKKGTTIALSTGDEMQQVHLVTAFQDVKKNRMASTCLEENVQKSRNKNRLENSAADSSTF